MSQLALKNPQDPLAYHRLRTALARFGKLPAALKNTESAAVDQQARREFEIESLVLGSPEARQVVVPSSVVDAAVHTIRQRYDDEEAFIQDIERNGLSMERLRQALERELKVEAVLDKVGSRAADVSDVDAMLYYYMHPEKFSVQETRQVRHILITINEDYAENRREAAHARIRELAERLKGHRGKSKHFAELAMKHSECPTAMHGGVLGRLPRGQLYPELEEVLFQMPAGEISEVIASPLGYHLLYCEAVHPAGQVSLDEAMPKIKEKLVERRQKICQRSWIKGLAVKK